MALQHQVATPNSRLATEAALTKAASLQLQSTRIVNFDPVARMYRWLEYFSFGPLLSRCRIEFLDRCRGARRVLILGEGDGRFLEQLLRTNREAKIDVVDSSAAMLAEAGRRIACLAGEGSTSSARLLLHCSDIFAWEPVSSPFHTPDAQRVRPAYDLVVTHFFLDCFSTEQLVSLVRRLRPYLSRDCVWVVSDFAVPASVIGSRLAGLLIEGLYRAFGLLTGLRVRRLPEHAAVLTMAGFTLRERRLRLGGVLSSELWRAGES